MWKDLVPGVSPQGMRRSQHYTQKILIIDALWCCSLLKPKDQLPQALYPMIQPRNRGRELWAF